jgi:hypothetical protein
MDATRFDQFGRWSGVVRHPEGEIRVDPTVCLGTKDRSWGVRGVGEPETGGAPPQRLPGFFFLWAPLFWDDHVTHAIFFDGPRGEALIREGIVAPHGHGASPGAVPPGFAPRTLCRARSRSTRG